MSESFLPRFTAARSNADSIPDSRGEDVPVGLESRRSEYFSPYSSALDKPNFEAKPFSAWREESGRTGVAQDYADYSNYLRANAIRQGAYTLELEENLRTNTVTKLLEKGFIPDPKDAPEEFEVMAQDLLFKPALTEDQRLSIAMAGLGTSGQDEATQEARDVLSRYAAAKPAFERLGEDASEEYVAEYRALEAQAKEILTPGNSLFETAKKNLNRASSDTFSGVIVEFPEGDDVSFDINEEAVEKLGYNEAVARGVEQGLISPKNVAHAMALNQPVQGTDVPMWKLLAEQRAAAKLESLSTMENAVVPLSEEPKGLLHSAARALFTPFLVEDVAKQYGRLGGPADKTSPTTGMWWWKEMAADQDKPLVQIVNKYAEHLADIENGGEGHPDMFAPENEARVMVEIQHAMRAAGEEPPTPEALSRVLRRTAVQRGLELGLYEYETDPELAHRNIRTVPGSPVPIVHPALYMNKPQFDLALANHTGLTDGQKQALEASRVAALEGSFDYRDKQLSGDSTHAAAWNEHKIRRLHEGAQRHEILAEYFANEDNFSEFQDRMEGIGDSIVNGVTEMVAALPAIGGAEWATDHLVKNAKERTARREIREAFGVETDFWYDAAETVAPMITDVVVTAALAPATAGGSVALFGAKQGAKLTAKGFIKGVVGGAFRATADEATEVAQKAMLKGLVKDTVDEKGVLSLVEGYNKAIQSNMSIAAAQFIPAANRSAAATYGSTYASLEGTNMTHEQKHQTAKGAALLAGATTGLITGAFGYFGRGGAEDALLSGATRGQMKALFARLGNTSDISDAAFNAIVAKQLRTALKAHALTGGGLLTKYAKGFLDEGTEEFIDEMVNSVVQGAYMGEDVPLMDSLQQGFHSFLLGGMFGAALPAGMDAGQAVRTRMEHRFQSTNEAGPATPTPRARSAMRAAEDNFIKNVTAELEKTGNPLTAKVLGSLLREGANTRTAGGLNRSQIVSALRAPSQPVNPEPGAPNPESGTPATVAGTPNPESPAPEGVTEQGAGEGIQVPADPELDAAYEEAMKGLTEDHVTGTSEDFTLLEEWRNLQDVVTIDGVQVASLVPVPVESLFTLMDNRRKNDSKTAALRERVEATAADGLVQVNLKAVRWSKSLGEFTVTADWIPSDNDTDPVKAGGSSKAFRIPLSAVPKANLVAIYDAILEERTLQRNIANATPAQKARAVRGTVPGKKKAPKKTATAEKVAPETPKKTATAEKVTPETPKKAATTEKKAPGTPKKTATAEKAAPEAPEGAAESVEAPRGPAKRIVPGKKTVFPNTKRIVPGKKTVFPNTKRIVPGKRTAFPKVAEENLPEPEAEAPAGVSEELSVDADKSISGEASSVLVVNVGATQHTIVIKDGGAFGATTPEGAAWFNGTSESSVQFKEALGEALEGLPDDATHSEILATILGRPAETQETAAEEESVPDLVDLVEELPAVAEVADVLGEDTLVEPFEIAPFDLAWDEKVTGSGSQKVNQLRKAARGFVDEANRIAKKANTAAVAVAEAVRPSTKEKRRAEYDALVASHAKAVATAQEYIEEANQHERDLQAVREQLVIASGERRIRTNFKKSRTTLQPRGNFVPWTVESLTERLGEDVVAKMRAKALLPDYVEIHKEADPVEIIVDTLNDLLQVGFPVSFSNRGMRYGLPNGGVLPKGMMGKLSELLHESISKAYPTRVYVSSYGFEAVQAPGATGRGKALALKTTAFATPAVQKDFTPAGKEVNPALSEAENHLEAFFAAKTYEARHDSWRSFVEATKGAKASINVRFSEYINAGPEKAAFDEEAKSMQKKLSSARAELEENAARLAKKSAEAATRAQTAGRVGIFDNNPVNTAIQLANGLPVPVFPNQMADLNPAIVVVNGWVSTVFYPEQGTNPGETLVRKNAVELFQVRASKSRDKSKARISGESTAQAAEDPMERAYRMIPAARFTQFFYGDRGFAAPLSSFIIPASYGIPVAEAPAKMVGPEKSGALPDGGTLDRFMNYVNSLFVESGGNRPKIEAFFPPSLVPRNNTADTSLLEVAKLRTREQLFENAVLASMKVSTDRYLAKVERGDKNLQNAGKSRRPASPEAVAAGLRAVVLGAHPELQTEFTGREDKRGAQQLTEKQQEVLNKFTQALSKRFRTRKGNKLPGTTPTAILDSFINEVVLPFETAPGLSPQAVAGQIGAQVAAEGRRMGSMKLSKLMSTMAEVETDAESGATQLMLDQFTGADLVTGEPSVSITFGEEELVRKITYRLSEIATSEELTAAQKRAEASSLWDDIVRSELFAPDTVSRLYSQGFIDFVSPPVERLAERFQTLSAVVVAYADKEIPGQRVNPLRKWIEDKLIEIRVESSEFAYGSTERARAAIEQQPTSFLIASLAAMAQTPGVSPTWRASLSEEKLSEVILEGDEGVPVAFGSLAQAFGDAGDTTPARSYVIKPATIRSFLSTLVNGSEAEILNVARDLMEVDPEMASILNAMSDERAATMVETVAETIRNSAANTLGTYHRDKPSGRDVNAAKRAAIRIEHLQEGKRARIAAVSMPTSGATGSNAQQLINRPTSVGSVVSDYLATKPKEVVESDPGLALLKSANDKVVSSIKDWSRTIREVEVQRGNLTGTARAKATKDLKEAKNILAKHEDTLAKLEEFVDTQKKLDDLDLRASADKAVVEAAKNSKELPAKKRPGGERGSVVASKLEEARKARERSMRARRGYSKKLSDLFATINNRVSGSEGSAALLQRIKERKAQLESGALNAPSYYNTTQEQAEANRKKNHAEIEFLGLVNGDPESVITAFEKIVSQPDVYPTSIRVVASLLLQNPELIRNTVFNIFPMAPLVSVAGRFTQIRDGRGQVVINPNGSNGLGLASVLLHEYVHAATHSAINNPNRTPAQQGAVTRLSSILKLAQKAAGQRESGDTSLVLLDGLANLDEFVTHLFTSSDFQRQLKMLTAPGSPKSFFARAWEAILKMFGFEPSNPVYDAAIDAAFDLASASVPSEPLSLSSIARGIAQGTYGELQRINQELQRKQRLNLPLASSLNSPVTDPSMLQETELFLSKIRSLVPNETLVIPSVEHQHTMWEENGLLFFNPSVLSDLFRDVPPDQQQALMERLVSEERVHVATRRALSAKDITEYAASLSDQDYQDEAALYGNDTDDALTGLSSILADLASADPEIVQRRKEMLASERIRRQVQQVLYGESTEDVVAYNRTNDVARKKFIRALKKQALQLTESRRLAGFDPKTRAMLSRVITEIRAANLNYRPSYSADSVFSPNVPYQTLQILAAQVGATSYVPSDDDRKEWAEWKPENSPSEIPTDIQHLMRDFRPIFSLLEVPLTYAGEYVAPEKFMQHFVGAFDPRAQKIRDNHEAFMRMVSVSLKNYQADLTRAVDKAVAEGADRAELSALIAESSGSTSNVLPDEVAADIDKKHDELLLKIQAGDFIDAESIEARVAADIASDEFFSKLKEGSERLVLRKFKLRKQFERDDKRARIAEANAARDAYVDKLEADYRLVAKKARDGALAKLSAYPKVLQQVVQLRQLLDEFSLQTKKVFNNSERTNAHIDNQLGIYITRTYRMFHDPEYKAELTDATHERYADHEQVRKDASDLLLELWSTENTNRLMDENPEMSLSEAQHLTEKKLTSMPTGGTGSYGQFLLNEFLDNYDHPVNDPLTLATSESFKLVTANLKRRKNIPPALQKLLGVYDKEYGEQLLVRAISNVSAMVSNQNMLNQLKKVGTENKWLLTEDQFQALRKEDLEKSTRFKPIRILNGASSKHNPFHGLYGPVEVVEAMAQLGSKPMLQLTENVSEQAVRSSLEWVNRATGKVMAIKTLGSIGHYFRNMISMPFFAMSQGYFNPAGLTFDMMQALPGELKQVAGRGVQESFNADLDFDAERAELIGLGVLSDSVNANTLRDMLSGTFNTKELEESYANTLKELGAKGVSKAKDFGRALVRLEEAMDAFYKVPYYKQTLKMLQEAKEVGTGKIDGVDISSMSDYDLKRAAATKVLRTAPSYSQTLPIVAAFSKSSWSNIVAPFVRWKSEMYRTTINTFRMAREEINSGNPVLAARGRWRMIGMFTINAASVALPAAISYFFAGLDYEEDDALRKTLPEFARNNSLVYFDWGGELKSVDLTFVNPFSFSSDGVSRAIGEMANGDYVGAATKLVTVTFLEPFLDEQILFSTMHNVIKNTDPVSGRPIWNEGGVDDLREVIWKQLKFISKEAVMPRIALDTAAAINSGMSPATADDYTPLALFMNGVYPFRIRPVDLEASYNRYLYESQKKREAVAQEKSALVSRKPMTDDAVRRSYRGTLNKTIRMNEELRTVSAAFQSMGIPGATLFKAQKEAGVGERRAQLLIQGFMERPVPSPVFRERMLRDEWGAARLAVYEDEIRKVDRIIRLEK